jgi:hypothetical protein
MIPLPVKSKCVKFSLDPAWPLHKVKVETGGEGMYVRILGRTTPAA